MNTLVTGAGRGLGLELVRQLTLRGDRVHAVVRDPSRAPELQALAQGHLEQVVVHQAEVTRESDVQALARALGDEPLDLLLNNAGTMGGVHPLAEVEAADLLRTFEVNAVAPLLVTRALLPALARGAHAWAVHVSTKMASLSDNTSGGYYAYRMSKVALNMMSRSLAVDLAGQGVSSIVMHPGWVKTDMGGPNARLEVEDAARAILQTVAGLDRSASGTFIDLRGRPVAW